VTKSAAAETQLNSSHTTTFSRSHHQITSQYHVLNARSKMSTRKQHLFNNDDFKKLFTENLRQCNPNQQLMKTTAVKTFL